MNQTKKVFLFLFGIMFFTLISCEKADDHDLINIEIPIDGSQTSIETVADDIEYKFCLLNEAGQPATIFNNGENFSFYFSVTNKRNEKLYFDADYIHSNENDFCRVYNSERKDLGKPFILKGVNLIGIGGYPFNSGEAYIFEQKWVDNRETTWNWHHGIYESAHKDFLPKGKYYTYFQYKFHFRTELNNTTLETDSVSFRINFEIQ